MTSFFSNAYILGLAVVVFFLSGCATMDMDKASMELKTYMARCTSKFGYNPDDVSGIGEHELAPKEREWRSCVYEGIQAFIIPNTTMPEIYKDFISQDRKMTDAIGKGEMSRSQRKKRIAYMIKEIKRREDEKRAKNVTELKRARESAEGYARQMDMQQNLMKALGR